MKIRNYLDRILIISIKQIDKIVYLRRKLRQLSNGHL